VSKKRSTTAVQSGAEASSSRSRVFHQQQAVGRRGAQEGTRAFQSTGRYAERFGRLGPPERSAGHEEQREADLRGGGYAEKVSYARVVALTGGEVDAGQEGDEVDLFDPQTVSTPATRGNPRQLPVGIDYVFVNGTPVIAGGAHTGAVPGRALRRGRD